MARRIPESRFQDLLEAASAVFIDQGYRRTQMADVAARLGVAKGTLYLYVESKEALFDAVLQHADAPSPIELPGSLPVPTPEPGATLKMVEKRVAEQGALPSLAAALECTQVDDVRGELQTILRELYSLLSRFRTSIKLLDRCAHDHPELAAVWYRTGRGGALNLLGRYLEQPARHAQIREFADVAIAARLALETLVFWAVHHHWDPAPQQVDAPVAEDTVIRFILDALVKE